MRESNAGFVQESVILDSSTSQSLKPCTGRIASGMCVSAGGVARSPIIDDVDLACGGGIQGLAVSGGAVREESKGRHGAQWSEIAQSLLVVNMLVTLRRYGNNVVCDRGNKTCLGEEAEKRET